MTWASGSMLGLSPMEQPVQKERLPMIAPLLALFILGAATVSTLQDWNVVVKVAGWVLAVFAGLFLIREGFKAVPEVFAYSGWVLWSFLGLYVSMSTIVFWYSWQRALQMAVLAFIVCTFTTNRKTLSFILGTLLVGGMIVAGYSYVTGEFQRAGQEGEVGRVSGLVLNANEFAWHMTIMTAILAYFWGLPSRWPIAKSVVLAGLMGLAAVSVVLTASRMGFAGLIVFYVAWFWFCYRKDFFRKPGVMLAVLLVVGMVGVMVAYSISGSHAAVRFADIGRAFRGQQEVEGGVNIRFLLLERVWQIFTEHPFLGIGMGNFMVVGGMGRMSAHSEYGSVLAETGLPGFLLHFSIYVFLAWRCWKIRRSLSDPVVRRIAGLGLALLVAVFVTDWANVNQWNKTFWTAVAAFTGYTYTVWYQAKHSSSLQAAAPADTLLQPQGRV